MIDIVIPLGKGSRWENNELRYSLRSIEKHAKNFRNIYIIGERPSWVKDIYHIKAHDTHGHERNIVNKFLIACDHPGISENFLMWNDDFYLLDDIDCANYPNYASRDLQTYIQFRHRMDAYRISMDNTLRILTKRGLRTTMFDIHCPMIYNKSKFKEIMNSCEWRVQNGYVIKSLYANSMKLDHVEMIDQKLHGNYTEEKIIELVSGRHIFSVSDKAINNHMRTYLIKQYPLKSKYEI